MSLARTLLNGVSESAIDITGFECGEVSMESSTLDSACEALINDIYTVDKAYHTADIIGEVQVLKEGADGEALLEGMISSGIEKLKNAFKKFWAKIQAWFAAVKKYFKSLYLKGKDFVKEFRKEIIDKKATGFKYHAFKYTLESKGDPLAEKVFNTINDEIDRCAANIKKGADGSRDTSKIEAQLTGSTNARVKAGQSEDAMHLKVGSDFQEEFIKTLGVSGATTTSELSEEIAKAYRNGEEDAEDFEEFESNSKNEMLDLVENSDKKIKDFEKDEAKFEKDVKAIIKALDAIKKDNTNEEVYKVAQRRSSQASALLSLGKIPCDVKVAAYKEAASSYRSILGAFVRFKPAKEGAEMDDEEMDTEGCGGGKKKCATESLLDVAMNLL